MSDRAIIEIEALVVGAGFAGLYALHRLRGIGVTAHVVEAAEDVGGVWHWNRYPGARCDVESMEYSYSFSNDLQHDWSWSERYAAQPEILAYLRHVADRFDLRRDISFGTRVVAMAWSDEGVRWRVTTDTGTVYAARYCVMASGSLSATRLPDIPGIDDFAGAMHHTGAWPFGGVDFTGRRVAVIGTGSSGVQSIPKIAEQAEKLIVLQRTPGFVIPAHNAAIDPAKVALWKANLPALRARARQVGTMYDFSDVSALTVSSAERDREYRRRWDRGGVNFLHAFDDIMRDDDANATAAEFVRDRIRETVDDPVVAERLCPRGYPIGAKRICVGTGYYETFNRANVELVDLQTTPVTTIEPHAIRTTTASHPIDTIVCATGYDALTGALTRIDVRGRDGRRLKDHWAAGPRTYLGLMVTDFPNMFIVTGPGSPSVLVNMVIGIEQHIEWIADCIAGLRARGATSIEPAPSAEDEWVDRVNDVAAATLFIKAKSWYLGANIPGKPQVFMPFAGGIGAYRAICDAVAADGYKGFTISESAGDRA